MVLFLCRVVCRVFSVCVMVWLGVFLGMISFFYFDNRFCGWMGGGGFVIVLVKFVVLMLMWW